MEFGEEFERRFVTQGQTEERTVEETLDRGWEVLGRLPAEELHRVTEEELETYYGR